MDNSTEHLKKLAKLFGKDRIVSSEEMDYALKGILEMLSSFKKDNAQLTVETKSLMEDVYKRILIEHYKIAQEVASENKGVLKLASQFEEKISELKSLMEETKRMKPLDGLDGADADEDKIIKGVLSKIKIPEPKEAVLDDREKIVRKINTGEKNDLKIELKQIGGTDKLTDFIVNRAIGIVDQRTSFLINKVSNLQTTVDNFNIAGAVTLDDVSTNSTNATKSTYTMTSGVDVIFKSSDGNNMFRFNEATEAMYMGSGTTTFTVVGSSGGIIGAMAAGNTFYIPFTGQNTSAGSTSSTDIVLGNNLATDTTNYTDWGLSSSNNSDALYTALGAGYAYWYNQSGGMSMGTAGAFPINFFTNGTLTANIRATILPGGNFGIGTTNPLDLLDVSGSNTNTTLTTFGTPTISVINTNTTVNNFESFAFRSANSIGTIVTSARISGINTVHTAAAESGELVFLTMIAGTLAERMRIGVTGNVLIGSTSSTSYFKVLMPNTASVGTTPGTASGLSVQVTGGVGGATTITDTGVGGVGAGITMSTGNGGTAASALVSSTGGAAGTFNILGGNGGAAAVAGTGTNTGGVGGPLLIQGGVAGAATGATNATNTGAVGGTITILGGSGGAANSGSGNNVGGAGGAVSLAGGTGGVGVSSGGNGGAATIQGGSAAAMAGAAGGSVAVTGRAGSSTGTGGGGGNVSVTGGAAGGDETVSRIGGTLTLLAGVSKGDSAGGAITLTSGNGGTGTGTAGANGGAITLTPGAGGVGSATGANGGHLNLNGGLGGDSIADGAGGSIIFSTALTITRAEVWRIDANGRLSAVGASPTAVLHLKAGTATASTAPLKFNTGTLLTSAEAGAVEFLTDSYYVTTTTGAIRRMVVAGNTGRATGQTAANASVATYTLGASDATFEVSANVLVTTSSAEAFTVTVTYTDEGNTSRTITLPFALIAGTFSVNIAFANGAVPYEGVPLHIRCKASTAITIKTAAGGTYTGCTYNVEGVIKQTA